MAHVRALPTRRSGARLVMGISHLGDRTMPSTSRNSTRGHARRTGRLNHDNNFAALKRRAAVVQKDVRELAETAGESALDMMGPIEEYVQRKPVKSLLIAAGLGAIFGVLCLRR